MRRGGVTATVPGVEARSGGQRDASSTTPDHEGPPRRTRLTNEGTYLAWWRSGLSAFGVALGAGGVVPALTKGNRWPYVVVGVGFALLGVTLVVILLVLA